MNVYTLPKELHTVPATPRIIALGVFDGVHIGHRAVLARALSSHTLSPAVFTFCGMENVKTGGALQTDEQRRHALELLGFADVFEGHFDEIRDLSPAAFVDLLKEKLCAKAIVCGYNFHFGKGGVGDTALLASLCEQAGITLHILPAVTADGEAVSSTRIKQALANGDIPTVTRLLSRPFTLSTKVVGGEQRGRTFGAPTINQPLTKGIVTPRFGVYATIAIVDGKAMPAVTNIGMRPTVGSPVPLAETYILDFESNLYNETVPVQLVKFLRPEQKFDTVDALRLQIQKDIANTAAVFAPQGKTRAILFDFDNTLQDREIATKAYMRRWLQKHFPTLSDKELDAHSEALRKAGEYGFVPYRYMFKKAVELFPDYNGFDFNELLSFLKVEYPLTTTLFPETIETLQKLRDKGYLIGLVTNGNSRIQNCKLDVAGIRSLFDYVLVTGDEGIQKPDTQPFIRAALRLGVHPTDCVYVGDNPINDIQGADNAGMKTVFRDLGCEKFFKYDFTKITAENAQVEEICMEKLINREKTVYITSLDELLDIF
ncbi:MAG: riboflavin biosynthesis protein RibF [Clostridia bacterium]|nr:riboflavin biosynthesis protein RibF [Clostridia bacterium]